MKNKRTYPDSSETCLGRFTPAERFGIYFERCKMSYPKNITREIAFRKDNTAGYNQQQLDTLNFELSEKLEGLEMWSDNWFQTAKMFADDVSRR